MGFRNLLLVGGAIMIASAFTAGTIEIFIRKDAFAVVVVCWTAFFLLASSKKEHRCIPALAVMIDILASVVLVVKMVERSAGLWLIVIASAVNLLPVLANGFRMPAPDTQSPLHVSYDPERTRMWLLTDIFPTTWGKRIGYFSVGDAWLVIGIWVFIAELWLARL
jgi:uncharacterized protein DUF5317